jgi:predicted ester cyclase
LGVAATGKSVAYSGLDIVRVADGKAVEHCGYVDFAGFMRQISRDQAE